MRCTRFELALLVVVGSTLLLAALAPAREVTVVTTDGRRLSGELASEDAKEVVLLIAGIRTPVPRAEVKDVLNAVSLTEQYADRRAKLEDTDIKGRYDLVIWLMENKLYDLAKKELDDLVARAPNDETLARLKAGVDQRLAQATPPTPGTPGTPTTPTPTASKGDLPTQLLTEEQINLIKVYEVDLKGIPSPRITVPKDVLEALFTTYKSNLPRSLQTPTAQGTFRGEPGWKQLETIFAMSSADPAVRSVYGKVKVADDPPALRVYRNSVQSRYVLSYCATAECHGGASAGKFFLFRERPDKDEVTYTNFYIVQAYAGTETYMVDRSRPEKSLLIQYGLPKTNAATPHPDVAGWRPALLGARDPKHAMLVDWMKKLYSPAPRYGIDYVPPVLPSKLAPAAATQPAAPAPAAPTPGAPTPATPAPPANPAPAAPAIP